MVNVYYASSELGAEYKGFGVYLLACLIYNS